MIRFLRALVALLCACATPATANPVALGLAAQARATANSLTSLREAKGPMVLVALGDSLTMANSDRIGGLQGSWAYWNNLQWLSFGRIAVRAQAGVPGNTSTMIAVRAVDEALNYPGIDGILLLECTNDNNQAISNATCFANDRAIIRAAKARGLQVILLAIPPSNTGDGANSLVINATKQTIAAQEGAIFVDPWAGPYPMRASDGTWILSSDTQEGTHPTEQGAKKAALNILAAPALAPLLPKYSSSAMVIAGELSSTIPNSDFSATSSNTLGTYPTGWSFYSGTTGYTTSVAADPISGRNLFVAASSATTTGQAVLDSGAFDISMFAGKRIRFTGRVSISGMQGVSGAYVTAQLQGADAQEGSAGFVTIPFYQMKVDGDGYFYGEAQVPASSSSAIVRVKINAPGSAAVIKVGEFSVRLAPNAIGLIDTRSARIPERVRTVTAAYTMTVDDHYVLCDATSAAVTVTLPAPGANSYGYGAYTSAYQRNVPGQGLRYEVWKIDSSANACTVALPTGASISGSTASVSLATQYARLRVLAARTNIFLDEQ